MNNYKYLTHAKLEGRCGVGTEKQWITPWRPLESHLSGSRRSARSYTAPYPPPPWGETIPISVPPSPIYDSVPTND